MHIIYKFYYTYNITRARVIIIFVYNIYLLREISMTNDINILRAFVLCLLLFAHNELHV